MKRLVTRVASEEEGQDLIEYALLMALIALVCTAAITAGGTSIAAVWETIRGMLETATAAIGA